MSPLPTDCVRARESVSVQLDGELPEPGLDRLQTHLRFCPECSAWADQVRDVTLRLREASVEAPSSAGFVLPRHTRRWRVSSAVALASAAAVVAAMFVASGRHGTAVGLHTASAPSSLPRLAQTPSVSRLEDGRFAPIATSPVSFQPL